MKGKKIYYVGLIIIMITLFLTITTDVKAEGLGYSVRAVIPENQVDKDKTFFDLLVKPGTKQKLELEIISFSQEAINLAIEPNIATTNQNGELEYSEVPKEIDETMEQPLTDLLSKKQLISLKSGETKVVSFNLEVPQDDFKGKTVGAFNIFELEDDQIRKSKKEDGVQISNVMSVGIGIQLRTDLKKVEPELRMNKVRANLFNYRTAITANLQNIKAEFLGELMVSAKINKEGSKEVLYEIEKSEMSMAPNSNFDFPIPLNNKEIEKGKYELDLVATSNRRKWQFKQNFTITREEAKKLNQEAVEVTEKGTNWLLLIFFTVIIVILLVITWMLTKLYQEKQVAHHIRKRGNG